MSKLGIETIYGFDPRRVARVEIVSTDLNHPDGPQAIGYAPSFSDGRSDPIMIPLSRIPKQDRSRIGFGSNFLRVGPQVKNGKYSSARYIHIAPEDN